MGVPVINPGSNRENCPKISTACVIWQGPDIPCINLCAGDAIDEVVFKLATYLCELSQNIFNIENVNFSCMLPVNMPREDMPTNLEELIQLMINYSCGATPVVLSENSSATPSLLSAAKVVGTSSTGEPILELPECLYYINEEGDLVKVLLQSDYITYVATKLCEVILEINTLNTRVSNLESSFNRMQQRLNTFPATFNNDIYVVSQCASSFAPGKQVLIQDAFTYLERNYCNLTSAIGTVSTLYNGINSQIPNLSNLPQLMNKDLFMSDIPKWVSRVSNIGDSLSNIWLTMNDMRNKILEIANTTYALPCILLSPENATLGTVNQYGATIYWEKPSVANVKTPTSYSIQVFDLNDTEFKNVLFSKTTLEKGTANTCLIVDKNIQANTTYVVHISAIYECGMSNPATLTGVLLDQQAYFDLTATITTVDGEEATCTDAKGTNKYVPRISTISFRAINKITGLPAVNEGTQPVSIIVQFETTICDSIDSKLIEQQNFKILPGQSVSNEYVFTSSKLNICDDGLCGKYEKYYSCGVFISDPTIEFESKYGYCIN